MRQAEINRQICALQTQSEKYWEESGYKDEEKRLQEFGLNKDRFITENFANTRVKMQMKCCNFLENNATY